MLKKGFCLLTILASLTHSARLYKVLDVGVDSSPINTGLGTWLAFFDALVTSMKISENVSSHCSGNDDTVAFQHESVLHRQFVSTRPEVTQILRQLSGSVWPPTDDDVPKRCEFRVGICSLLQLLEFVAGELDSIYGLFEVDFFVGSWVGVWKDCQRGPYLSLGGK